MDTGSIDIQNLSKRFRVHQERNFTLKERLIYWKRAKWTDFWALKDIHLAVAPGESIGLVGRNGSGKSTLLKVISGILFPDQGTVNVHGKVSSLLELGAGFHPEFSGRENIFVNGTIMGLSRRDIKERIDQIIEFSELGRFIDEPVRSYSSGMYMRLGFSVAINIDPDILLVDEVLAVGDARFQEKCIQKFYELKALGKTIVFVSHDAGAVAKICDRCVWLQNGHIVLDSGAAEVLETYAEKGDEQYATAES
ncbi:MAG: transporter related protein [Bacilli bacterium]|nr:transporter related protein [Bacilli bacterium]